MRNLYVPDVTYAYNPHSGKFEQHAFNDDRMSNYARRRLLRFMHQGISCERLSFVPPYRGGGGYITGNIQVNVN